TPAGDVFISGLFPISLNVGGYPVGCPSNCIFLAKVRGSDGVGVWGVPVASVTGDSPRLFAPVAATSVNGGVVVAGRYDKALLLGGAVNAVGVRDIFVFKCFDGKSCNLWQTSGTAGQSQYIAAVAADPMDNVYITGQVQGTLSLTGCAPLTPANTGGDG